MKNALIIAKYTFIEVYRSKIMIGLVFMSMAVLLVAYVASEFAYGAPEKVALDFGLGIMSLSNLFVAMFLGATLISKEVETKTLYMILSRPLSRTSFLAGKISGLSSVLVLNTIFISSVSIGVFIFLGGKFSSLMIWTGFFSFIEAIIIMLFAVFFSLISNVTMSVIFTIVVAVAGHTINGTTKIFVAKSSSLFLKILNIANFIIPDLERFNTKDFLIYQQELSFKYLFGTQAYASFLILGLFLIIAFTFNQKNLD